MLGSALSAAFALALALALAPHGPRCHQDFEGLVRAHGCHCGVRSVCCALRRSTHTTHTAVEGRPRRAQQLHLVCSGSFEFGERITEQGGLAAQVGACHVTPGPAPKV